MGSRTTSELLQLPVQLHGIRLGRAVDVLLDAGGWRVLGFVVLCGDEAERFLPFAAAEAGDGEIAVVSALMLLDDVAFYSSRSESLRALLGGEVESGGRPAGRLRDLVVRRDGTVLDLVVERDDRECRLQPRGASVLPQRVSAA